MALINRRSDEVKTLEKALASAPTFGEWLCILSRRHALRQAEEHELSEMRRLSQGWVYISPPKCLPLNGKT